MNVLDMGAGRGSGATELSAPAKTATTSFGASAALGTSTLVAAIITTGLLAGVYYAYAISVMPALHRLDDRTFVEVMNRINVVIVNPPFMLSFFGSVILTGIAATAHLRTDQRSILWWVLIALGLNVVSLCISIAGNIPLNNGLTDVSGADFAVLRQQFETPWVRLNIARALANTAAIGCLAMALRAGR